MRDIDRTAKHPTQKPNTFHSGILLPVGAIHNRSSIGQPKKSPFLECKYYMPQHMCGFFIFLSSELKREQMIALMEVKKEARNRKKRILGG